MLTILIKRSWLNISNPTTPAIPTIPVNRTNTTLPSPITSTAPINLTLTGIDTPYIEYVGGIPTLASALITLGRAWHSEYNRPVYDAIDALQLAMNTFQTSCLKVGLIHSNSTLRTIRAGSSLEDAQTAWSKPLNLPGHSQATQAAAEEEREIIDRRGGAVIPLARRQEVPVDDRNVVVRIDIEQARDLERQIASVGAETARLRPGHGKYYTHKELWGRQTGGRQSLQVEGKAMLYGGLLRYEE